ncbi:hypothetical protein BT96DRAFT_948859 [Gymnopus androsaceus JB14]|uniref:Uncharacterized protein n=1 Tax=Gymnopus androsaceus JB14 TaxID=1447944 RepID=A0A6A4GNJ2_9AGAR|nr:hypothetical protein BT96DRAFT_948859 [Gymnopus androsaceus JB14]
MYVKMGIPGETLQNRRREDPFTLKEIMEATERAQTGGALFDALYDTKTMYAQNYTPANPTKFAEFRLEKAAKEKETNELFMKEMQVLSQQFKEGVGMMNQLAGVVIKSAQIIEQIAKDHKWDQAEAYFLNMVDLQEGNNKVELNNQLDPSRNLTVWMSKIDEIKQRLDQMEAKRKDDIRVYNQEGLSGGKNCMSAKVPEDNSKHIEKKGKKVTFDGVHLALREPFEKQKDRLAEKDDKVKYVPLALRSSRGIEGSRPSSQPPAHETSETDEEEEELEREVVIRPPTPP